MGNFKNDLPHGQGTYQYKNGDLYVGEWAEGKRNGKGSYAHSVGDWETDLYVGDFKNDQKDGYGIYTYTDGVRYIGEFKNDLKDGLGKYIFLNATTQSLECTRDKCVEKD